MQNSRQVPPAPPVQEARGKVLYIPGTDSTLDFLLLVIHNGYVLKITDTVAPDTDGSALQEVIDALQANLRTIIERKLI